MAEQPSAGGLGLSDDEYWTGEPLQPSVSLALLDAPGLVIGAPERIYLDAHRELPVVGYHTRELRDRGPIVLENSAVVTAVRIEDGRLVAGRAFALRRPFERAPSPPRDAPPGNVGAEFRLELTERVRGFELLPGTWITTLLLFDRASNRVQTRVHRAPIHDPEVAKYLEGFTRPAFPDPVWPRPPRRGPDGPTEEELPSYRRSSRSPPLPDGEGIELSVRRVLTEPLRVAADEPSAAGEGVAGDEPADEVPRERCVLRGSFRLPAPPRSRVRSRPEGRCGEAWRAVGDPEATAVLPITLLLTGDSLPAPWVVPLQVPVYEPLEPDSLDPTAAQPLVTGHFHVDLFDLDERPCPPQSYAVWAFSREVLGGPVKMAIVPNDLLPGPRE